MIEEYSSVLKLFGEHIKLHREKLGISQEELAALISSSRSFVSSVELGKTNPSLITIIKLCEVLSIQDMNFIFDKDRDNGSDT